MLNIKVDTHNARVKELERSIAEQKAKLANELEKGDLLKAEEIKEFADVQGAKTVWLWGAEQYTKVYAGEFFDFAGVKKELSSCGTHDGRKLKEQLLTMATLHNETRDIPWGDRDVRLQKILVVTFQ